MSAFAAAARARKVLALVTAADLRAIKAGLNPHADSARIAELLRSMGAAGWSQLARFASCKAPSAISVEAVIATYEARGNEIARAS